MKRTVSRTASVILSLAVTAPLALAGPKDSKAKQAADQARDAGATKRDLTARARSAQTEVKTACDCTIPLTVDFASYTRPQDMHYAYSGVDALKDALVWACGPDGGKRDAVCKTVKTATVSSSGNVPPSSWFAAGDLVCQTTRDSYCGSDMVARSFDRPSAGPRPSIRETPAADPHELTVFPAPAAPKAGHCVIAQRTHIVPKTLLTGVDAADFDGDGKPDLIVLEGSVSPDTLDSGIEVYASKGGGNFAAPVFSKLALGLTGPPPIAFGDLTGDGIPDAVYANEQKRQAVLLTGTKTGALKSPQPLGIDELGGLQIADFTGDRKLDLAYHIPLRNDSIRIAAGLGGGKLAKSRVAGGDAAAAALYDQLEWVAVDMDGDKIRDLVSLRMRGDAPIGPCVLTGKKGGSWAADGCFDAGLVGDSGNLHHVGTFAVADVNGDGKPDVITGAARGSYVQDKDIAVMLNVGGGKLGKPTRLRLHASESPSMAALDAVDVNADGKPDLVGVYNAGGGQVVEIALNQGNGTFGPPVGHGALTVDTHAQQPTLKFLDLDGDGTKSLVFASVAEVNIYSVRCK
ncbi:MAG: VCBS repeat-containing protein [Myxococcales bacterium]|nr:VCBS repeat-containing protein [Myxococcales bacterium]